MIGVALLVVAAILLFWLTVPALFVFQLVNKHKFNWREFTALFSDSYFDWLEVNEPDWFLH